MTLPAETSTWDASTLFEALSRHRVIEPERLATAREAFTGTTAAEFADQLVALGHLTRFQVETVLAGRAAQLALGPYRITDRCPTGFGTVRKATDASGTRSYLLRLFPLRSLWQARQAKKLVHLHTQLPAHSALVPLADVDTAKGWHYLVWPAVEGELLTDRIDTSGPMAPVEAAKMVRRIAEALAHCHRRSIDHGSLNPACVVLAPDGQPRLLDLGASMLLAQNIAEAESMFDTLSDANVYSELLASAAPELLADPTALSPAVDQFGLGVIAHFALTGLQPFEEEGLLRTLTARTSPAAPLRDFDPLLPESLAAIVDRMLAFDPIDRFLSMDETCQALTDFLIEQGAETAASGEAVEPEAPVLSAQSSSRSSSGSFSASSSGSVSWAGGSGMQPAERDGTNDSIQFELPDKLPEDAPVNAREPLATAMAFREEPPPVSPLSFLPTPPRPTQAPVPSTISAGDPPDQSLLDTQYSGGAGLGGGLTPSPDRPKRRTSSGTPEKAGLSLLLNSISSEDDVPMPTLPGPSLAAGDASLKPRSKYNPTGSGLGIKPVTSKPAPANPAPETDANVQSVLWKSVKRNVFFWQSPSDRLQISLFGPESLVPGTTVDFELFLHTPEAAENVRTMSRAFLRQSELLAMGQVTQEVKRESTLAVHIAVTNAGLSQSMMGVVWRGQPHRLHLSVHVPWESPAGQSPGLISVGKDNVRIGRVDFQVNILPRTS